MQPIFLGIDLTYTKLNLGWSYLISNFMLSLESLVGKMN